MLPTLTVAEQSVCAEPCQGVTIGRHCPRQHHVNTMLVLDRLLVPICGHHGAKDQTHDLTRYKRSYNGQRSRQSMPVLVVMRTCVRVRLCMHEHIFVRECMQICVYIHVHTHTLYITHTYTYIHLYMYVKYASM